MLSHRDLEKSLEGCLIGIISACAGLLLTGIIIGVLLGSFIK